MNGLERRQTLSVWIRQKLIDKSLGCKTMDVGTGANRRTTNRLLRNATLKMDVMGRETVLCERKWERKKCRWAIDFTESKRKQNIVTPYSSSKINASPILLNGYISKQNVSEISITWLSRPSMSNIKKKSAAQSGARGIRVTALGYAIKARPGPAH